MPVQKVRHLRLDRLRQQGAGPATQNLGERIDEGPWLRKLDDVIVVMRITPSVEKWRRRTPPRYAALPLHAVTNFRA